MIIKRLKPFALIGGMLLFSFSVLAANNTTLWGMGVKSCFTFNHAFEDWQQDKPFGVENYPFYREWLMGLASGLSASTGLDVLHGSDPDTALRAIDKICREAPGSDFFSAAMTLFGRMAIPGEESRVFEAPADRVPEQQKGTIEQPWPPAASMVPLTPTPMRAAKETDRGGKGQGDPQANTAPRPEPRQSERRKIEQHPRISAPPEEAAMRKELAGDGPQPRHVTPKKVGPTKAAEPAPSIAVSNSTPPQSQPGPASNNKPLPETSAPNRRESREDARISTVEEPSISGDEIPAIATQKTGIPIPEAKTCDDGSSIASNKTCPE